MNEKNTLALDIETRGRPFNTLGLSENGVAYLAYKLGKKRSVGKEDESDVEKECSFCALDQDLAEVICISGFDGTRFWSISPEITMATEYCGDQETVLDEASEEKDILTFFWNQVRYTGRLVTFNGKAFDVPILQKRSALLGVKPTRKISCRKYDETEHCDLMGYLSGYDPSRTKSLDFYCDLYKIPKDFSVTGRDIASLAAAGKWRDVAKKCIGDVQATHALYKKLEGSI
jgi:hypothetical protein